MKKQNIALMVLLLAGSVLAAPAWQQQVGPAAQDTKQIATVAKSVPATDYPAFTEEVLKAASALPLAPEAKVLKITQAVKALIGSAPAAKKAETIAAVYASVPINALAAVNEVLARAFDREKNKLTEAQFREVATNVLKRTADAVAKAEFPAARMSAALAVFQVAGSLKLEQAQKLADEVLPTTFNKALIVEVANEIAKGNYNLVQDMTDAKMVMDEATRDATNERLANHQLLATPPIIVNPVKTDSTQGQMLLSALSTQALPPVGVGVTDVPGLDVTTDPELVEPQTPPAPPVPPLYQGQTH